MKYKTALKSDHQRTSCIKVSRDTDYVSYFSDDEFFPTKIYVMLLNEVVTVLHPQIVLHVKFN